MKKKEEIGHKKLTLLFFFMFYFLNVFTVNSQIENNGKNYDMSKKFSIYVFGTYVSSAEVQNNLYSSDPIERNAFTDLKSSFGYGFDISFKPSLFNLDIAYYISSDLLILDQKDIIYSYFDGSNIINYKAHDKFTLIPIEMGFKWPLPVGTDNFKIYIGGGAGIYMGSHIRYVDNLTSQITSRKPGFSLNILAGLDYYIGKNIAASIELKFRDATFDTDSKFNYITTLPNPFSTRLIVDGVRIAGGFKYNF